MAKNTDLAPAALREYVERLDAAHGIWIGGKGQASSSGETFPVIDPASGAVITEIASATEADVTAAVNAAAEAFKSWRNTAPRFRSEILRKAFELMSAQSEELAGLMTWEMGKALPDARGEASYAAEFFRWFAEEAVRSEGDYAIPPAGGTRTMVTHHPVGVAALVTPWNFPAAMATRKIGPALAAGATVVLKPASDTPLTALAVVRILHEAGVPDGVVNLVPARNSAMVSKTWLEDPRVRMISFTGSTQVGRLLMEQAAKRVVNTSMELGGNASFIVGASANIDAAVDGAMLAKFRNGGQACTAANRFYVHESVADEFLQKFGERIAALKVGPGLVEGVDIGPVITHKAKGTITDLVDRALDAGAKVLAQAALPDDADGSFLAPTLLQIPDPHAEILRTEIFGPIAPVYIYHDDEEMLRLVNDTEAGLASYIYGSDLLWALKISEQIECGMIGVNRGLVSDPAAPFGGMKQSGIGREGAREGIREFQETQYFSVSW